MGNDWRILFIKLSLSDIIFKQHQSGTMGISVVIICLEFIAMIVGVILSELTPYKILPACAVFNIVLALVIGINNKIHNTAWKRAGEELNDVYKTLAEMGKELDEYKLKELQKENENDGDNRV